eukprot:scaffold156934_cov16-Prasinocladus_malaysianus.AAC.1
MLRYCSADAQAEKVEVRSINNTEVLAQQKARLQVSPVVSAPGDSDYNVKLTTMMPLATMT